MGKLLYTPKCTGGDRVESFIEVDVEAVDVKVKREVGDHRVNVVCGSVVTQSTILSGVS